MEVKGAQPKHSSKKLNLIAAKFLDNRGMYSGQPSMVNETKYGFISGPSNFLFMSETQIPFK